MVPASSAPLTLFLMTEKGFRVLEYIIAHLDTGAVARVVGARDEHLAQDYYAEIQALCAAHGIAFVDRATAGPAGTPYALAVAWRWLIHDDTTSLIVLHDSLLPRYRGFAPLVNSLINGEPQIGVTALYATAEFDRGPVLAQAVRPVQYPIKIAEAIALVADCYCEVLTRLWPALLTGAPLPATAQDEAAASYSLWRDEEDYRLDWQRDSAYLQRCVDTLGWPYAGASTLVDGQLLRVRAAEIVPDVVIENRTPGKVLFVRDGQPVVVCGQGLLRILDLRTEAGEPALPLKRLRTRFR